MDDDDEFGDLYTDVLLPFSTVPSTTTTTTTSSAPSNPTPADLNHQTDDEDFLYAAPDPKFTFSSKPTPQALVLDPPKPQEEPIVDRITPATSNLEERGEDSARVEEIPSTRVLEEESVIGEEIPSTRVLEDKGKTLMEERLEIDDLNTEPIIPGLIPGLSSGNFRGFDGGNEEEEEVGQEDVRDSRKMDSGGGDGDGDGSGGGGDDWDSDSEDDLQIVLNEKSGPMGMDGNGGLGSEDDDGEDFLIVADGGQMNQPIEEPDWGEDLSQAADGERKDAGDAAKTNGGVGTAVNARVAYSPHLYPPHHSQFKYVRPSAPVPPGGAIVGSGAPPGQVRPLVNVGPMAGRGRGDWRPVGVRPSGLPMQWPFGSAFGQPAWGNNSAGRGFGSGLDFTLPSHKTVFDIDIDNFEDKPWRHPGVDVSDFFNFGLNEENWKDYCKQLEQLRLEATMQSKIRVYESGRSEQDYDPDLPPELAAASGMHVASVENAQLGNADGGQADQMAQGSARARPPIPTGRAIQVEGGFGDRLPSIDTRPPRMRDSDAIIEIVLQDSMDDDPVTAKDDFGQTDDDLQRDDVKGGDNGEDTATNEYVDRVPRTTNGRKREMVGKREQFVGSAHDDMHEGNGSLPSPPEGPAPYYSGSKGRTSSYRHERRLPRGISHDRYSRSIAENDDDVIPNQNAQVDDDNDSQPEKSGESMDGEQNLDTSSLAAVEAAADPSLEHTVDMQDKLDLADSSAMVEGNEEDTDMITQGESLGDGSPLHSVKKQKLSSRVEHPAGQDICSGDDLRATHSSDNSKARSGSSRDYQKRRDGFGEEEVVQEGRSRRTGDVKRRDEDERCVPRKDDYIRDGRQEMDRNRMISKGREDSHLSYPYRERDTSSTHLPRVKPGDMIRSRERDNSVGVRLRRDDDTHGRRVKDEESRKRERVEEVGSRQRSKIRENERGEKDEHIPSRKRMENGDWRGHHDKDAGPRQRERDDVLVSRHESFDDSHAKRRKDEEYQRRELAEKENLHGYRVKEDTSRRKRERDDSLELRREDQPRGREKLDDNHSVRHREENWRQRERDDRRVKQSHEDLQSTREREGRGVVRSGRDLEEKSWVGSSRSKDETKGMAPDKEYAFKDKRRPNENSKRSDRADDDYFSQYRGRDNIYARDSQYGFEDRNPRHERSTIQGDRPHSALDSQLMHKERPRDNRRNKESEGVDQATLGSSKRKQEDHSAHRSEKVSIKVASEQVSGNALISGPNHTRDLGQSRLSSSASVSKKNPRENDALQQRHSTRKHREDGLSDDEHNSRKGRSKLERWTSHKDRDENTKSLTTSSKAKETSRNNADPSCLASDQPDEMSIIAKSVNGHPTGEERNAYDLEVDADPTSGSRQVESDKVEDDRHLDTVAKLKKRSERFKTPMATEKDATSNKKMDGEVLPPLIQSETGVDVEVKPERPARKRRWIGS